ncbi:acyl-CoA N-acyltransferase [Aulographum hederae CBS 113979]|uniref:Histone acetyltransferase type B catalytic subunit n=1 Tax=Aulographum hederae CBS 113979 TaxID=1176131 RepID=A0A6G1H3X1_9PEZI|nr:acyl-CoA N-acyltransferase [Aulographum hederae CBS 113979]
MAAEAAELLDYVAESNDSIRITLSRNGKARSNPFNPAFTYEMFGEEEKIFGYKDLEIELNFEPDTMRPSVNISHEGVFNKGPDHELTSQVIDIKEKLSAYLPDYAFSQTEDTTMQDGPFTPPGKRIRTYKYAENNFEIWASDLADGRAREFLRSMRILIPFFIEGGTCNFLDDPIWTLKRWKIFLLYEVKQSKGDSSYHFAGFSTSYLLWVFPSQEAADILGEKILEQDKVDPDTLPNGHAPDLLTWPSRERISQFLILPPYQGQSHGTHIYNTMMSTFLAEKNVFQVTVEDPNEAFDDLRDYCDLARMRTTKLFRDLQLPDRIPKPALDPDHTIPVDLLLPPETLLEIRQKSKFAPRQLRRVIEMQLLSRIPPRNRNVARISRKANASDENDRRYYFWRLLVKERIYKRNIDELAQFDLLERIEKVEQSLESVQEEYVRILSGLEKRGDGVAEGKDVSGGAEATTGAANGSSKKRRTVVEEDSDDAAEAASTPKKQKMAR